MENASCDIIRIRRRITTHRRKKKNTSGLSVKENIHKTSSMEQVTDRTAKNRMSCHKVKWGEKSLKIVSHWRKKR